MCHNIWPSRHYSENIEPDDRFILTFDNLAPSEVIGIELFSVNADLPSLLVVRSAECVAQNVDMYPQPVVRRSTRIIATTLMALGLATAVYLVILLLQFLILQTPLGH